MNCNNIWIVYQRYSDNPSCAGGFRDTLDTDCFRDFVGPEIQCITTTITALLQSPCISQVRTYEFICIFKNKIIIFLSSFKLFEAYVYRLRKLSQTFKLYLLWICGSCVIFILLFIRRFNNLLINFIIFWNFPYSEVTFSLN